MKPKRIGLSPEAVNTVQILQSREPVLRLFVVSFPISCPNRAVPAGVLPGSSELE